LDKLNKIKFEELEECFNGLQKINLEIVDFEEELEKKEKLSKSEIDEKFSLLNLKAKEASRISQNFEKIYMKKFIEINKFNKKDLIWFLGIISMTMMGYIQVSIGITLSYVTIRLKVNNDLRNLSKKIQNNSQSINIKIKGALNTIQLFNRLNKIIEPEDLNYTLNIYNDNFHKEEIINDLNLIRTLKP